MNQHLQMLKELGLDPSWDNHGFSDREETGCGCGKEKCETDAVVAKSLDFESPQESGGSRHCPVAE